MRAGRSCASGVPRCTSFVRLPSFMSARLTAALCLILFPPTSRHVLLRARHALGQAAGGAAEAAAGAAEAAGGAGGSSGGCPHGSSRQQGIKRRRIRLGAAACL